MHNDLIERLEALSGPSREVDAEIAFDVYAKPVGKHKADGGPIGYLWPEDNPSWSFGIRFPCCDRQWFADQQAKRPKDEREERLLIERDGALVLMNDLRVRPYTASLDATMTLVPEGWFISAMGEEVKPIVYVGDTHEHLCFYCHLQHRKGGRLKTGKAPTLEAALGIAALKATSAENHEIGRAHV